MVIVLTGLIYQLTRRMKTASHIIMFERIAELLKINRNSHAVRLGALAFGKAARTCTSLSLEIIEDYKFLKEPLLRSFCKTPDRFRVDFWSSRILLGETPVIQHSI